MSTAQLLLVEDDDAIADALTLHLTQSGLGVRRESRGDQALAVIERGRFDLLLLDLMLPGADGWDVCRAMRARHPQTPIIMISARSAEVHRVLGLELGADDYMAKPFSMLELVARVRAQLRRVALLQSANGAHGGQGLLSLGPFCLDAHRRELRHSDKLIGLTLREFDLMHFLMRHPGRAFSRQELLSRVWGDAFDGYEHTVNSHINRLRAKIEADPRNPHWLVTQWGVGYALQASEAART